MTDHDRLLNVPDRRPRVGDRVGTTLRLRPGDHRLLGQLALDLGICKQSIIRRCLVIAGVLPAEEVVEDVR